MSTATPRAQSHQKNLRQPAQHAAVENQLHYERHRPEETTLYRLVQEHIGTFFVQVETETGSGLPDFVKDEGWLYLAGIKDLFNGELVGYAMNEKMTKSLVIQALFRATANKLPDKGLIAHSDQGSQGGFNRSLQQCNASQKPDSLLSSLSPEDTFIF